MPRGKGNGSSALLETSTRTRIAPEMMTEGENGADEPKKRGRGAKKLSPVQIPIPAPKIATIRVPIVGTAILVVNKMSKKAKDEMLAKHMKKAKATKEAKDPFKDFLGSLHVLPGMDAKVHKLPQIKNALCEDEGDLPSKSNSWGYYPYFGFPSNAFKKAALSACKLLKDITRSHIAIAIRIKGPDGLNMVPVRFKWLSMREDVVRIGPFGNRVPDIRFRGGFSDWEATIEVSYDENIVSKEQVIALIENAGRAGIGEHRPEKEGDWGTFCVKRG